LVTPSDIENAARNRLNAVSSDFWASTEVIGECLYFACLDIATRAKCIESTSTDTSVSGTASYTKPSNCIEIKQITYDSQKIEVMPERQFFALNLSGQTATTGTPCWYYLWGDDYVLYPTPSTSALSISVKFVAAPAAITSGSQVLEIPVQFHHRLVNGVAYYMLLKDVDDPRTPIFEARWLKDVEDCVDEWRRSKNADKFGRVQLEETLVTSDSGIV
jgi:hypothetical protein